MTQQTQSVIIRIGDNNENFKRSVIQGINGKHIWGFNSLKKNGTKQNNFDKLYHLIMNNDIYLFTKPNKKSSYNGNINHIILVKKGNIKKNIRTNIELGWTSSNVFGNTVWDYEINIANEWTVDINIDNYPRLGQNSIHIINNKLSEYLIENYTNELN